LSSPFPVGRDGDDPRVRSAGRNNELLSRRGARRVGCARATGRRRKGSSQRQPGDATPGQVDLRNQYGTERGGSSIPCRRSFASPVAGLITRRSQVQVEAYERAVTETPP